MNWEQVAGFIRHVLTFLGGFLVARGVLDENTMMEVVSAGVTLIGVVWSFVRKTPASIKAQADEL